ncbi:MAG TPA: T9SS type A sorting domain-containing protein [Bacteroidia bacterium]|nr:T9SS type A sorting domain-containing protein [Bacteroidia bacterium]
MPPFTVQIEPVITTPLPALHSFAFAQSGGKWLIIGGRTNGLHGLNASGGFPPEYKNDAVFVIDTATWGFYSADLNQLSQTIADPMRSTNMQYIQEGNYLYMIGGYTYDSVAGFFASIPKLTAIHVDDMIDAVINAQPIASTIRQVTDTNFSICGGELGKLGNDYYLIFGHNFGGRYTDPPTPLFTQTYSDRIKKFNLSDDGTTINLSGFTYELDTNNFHRRDLNSGPVINPDNSFGIGIYGGVFRKDSNLPFREPIKITSAGTTINSSYQQVMNQYTCALMPIYDSVTQKMYTTFFGGISLYNYNDTTSLLTRDADVPFVDDITTMTVSASGIVEETILPIKLPALLGSNAKFVPTKNISTYANEVIRIRDLPNTKILAGYMFGGIRAEQGNFGNSTANDTVYRVFITPNNISVGLEEENNLIQNVQLFPNPSNGFSTLLFNLKNAEQIKVSLFDVTGKEIFQIANEEMQKGNQKININTTKLSAGIYICKVQSANGERSVKLVVGR